MELEKNRLLALKVFSIIVMFSGSWLFWEAKDDGDKKAMVKCGIILLIGIALWSSSFYIKVKPVPQH